MATFRESLKTTIEAARPDLTYCVPGAVRTGSLPAFYTRFGGYGERFTTQWELIVLVQVESKKDAYDTMGKLADDVYEALYSSDDALPTALVAFHEYRPSERSQSRFVGFMVVCEEA